MGPMQKMQHRPTYIPKYEIPPNVKVKATTVQVQVQVKAKMIADYNMKRLTNPNWLSAA